MADKTGIEWTDATLNVVTGCSRVSPGCDNCYMFAQWPRLRGMGVNGYQGDPDVPVLHGDRIEQIFRWKKPRRIFINSMSDTFHRDVPYDFIDTLFFAMYWTPRHTFQVLTKRPGIAAHWWETSGKEKFKFWPRNVWLGTSVESQKYQPRIRVLSRVPAPIRFVSVEPMLGPVTLGLDQIDIVKTSTWMWHKCDDPSYRRNLREFDAFVTKSCRRHCDPDIVEEGKPVSWVIVGGESGRNPRPMNEEWVRAIRDECAAHDVPFFFKQWGGTNKKEAGNTLDGRQHLEFPA